jgi:hypothetical protein
VCQKGPRQIAVCVLSSPSYLCVTIYFYSPFVTLDERIMLQVKDPFEISGAYCNYVLVTPLLFELHTYP